MKIGFILMMMSTMALGVNVAHAQNSKSDSDNPITRKWSGGYSGVPAFDQVKVEHFKPAFEEALSQNRADIQAITENPTSPNFENTIVALERSGEKMARFYAAYGVWSTNLKTPEFSAVESELEPKLAAFRDEVTQNGKLFQRIQAVYDSPEKATLTAEQQRLIWVYRNRFVMQGANLSDSEKTQTAEINQKLATLYTRFSQNMLADEEQDGLTVDQLSDLAGLPESLVDAAATAAEEKGLKGKWFISNTRSSMEPFLTYATNRALREKAFRIWGARGDLDNANNNNQIVSEIIQWRQARSKVFGYTSYADWHLADTMAKKPQAALDLMLQVWRPAVAQVKKDVAAMNQQVAEEGGDFQVQPWDYRFYAEKVRKAKYDLDFELVKPYLQLDHLREAMFAAASKLYGFRFALVQDVPVFHKSVTVYQVTNSQDELVGLWYFDPFARAGKKSGAWMSAYREQTKMDEKPIITLVSNNCNFIQGKPGEPVLISWDDAVTLFHEFGHALHGLNSNVTYPSISGTNTLRDFVEFPSQFNEHYLMTPEVLTFLTDQKGNQLPADLIEKIRSASKFGNGFKQVEFLGSGILDMKLHLAADGVADVREFEKNELQALGMPSEIIMRHRIPHFAHLFSSEDYAAGYYSYLWAQVLEHDAFEAFTEAGSPYDPVVAQRLRDTLFSVGNSVDPGEAYRAFRGRDPQVGALLRALGFDQ